MPQTLVALVLLSLGVLACQDSGDEAAPVGGQEFDGCEVVTEADARTILGSEAVPGAQPTATPAAATCVWEATDDGSAKQLQLSVFRGREFYGEDQFKGNADYSPVEVVGAAAFIVEAPVFQLHVLVGDYSTLLSVTGFEGAPALHRRKLRAQLVELGRTIVSKMPPSELPRPP